MTGQKCLCCSQASSSLGKPPNFIKALRCQNKASARFPLEVPLCSMLQMQTLASSQSALAALPAKPHSPKLLRQGCALQGFVLLSAVATPEQQGLRQGEGCSCHSSHLPRVHPEHQSPDTCHPYRQSSGHFWRA